MIFLVTFLKNRDAFGHEFKLRISGKDQRGQTAQTSVVGGTVTILILAISLAFLANQIFRMSDGALDNISENTVSFDFDAIGDVKMEGVMPVLKFDY